MKRKGNSLEEIRHRAAVLAVYPEKGMAKVRVDEGAECEACAAAALCGVGGQRGTMELEASLPKGFTPVPGQKVEIAGTERLHRKAIRLATVYPTLAVLATMVGLYLLTANQLVAALGGLGIWILCFVVLWMARKRIAREFTFEIRRLVNDDSTADNADFSPDKAD